MARIKFFKEYLIAVYIYGEKNGKHHEKHVLVLKKDENCQYGFDGKPIKNSACLKNKEERKALKEWILSHRMELEQAWEDVNNGKNPGMID